MSSISFATKDDCYLVSGRERAYMGVFLGDLAGGFAPTRYERIVKMAGGTFICTEDNIRQMERLKEANEWGVFAAMERNMASSLNLALRCGEVKLNIKGKQVDNFCVALNTAIAVGNDPVRVMARIHGLCEIHGWIANGHRHWFANVIEQGITDKVFRDLPERGFRGLCDWIRQAEGDVVMSYSVCDTFNFERDKLDKANQISPKRITTYFDEGVSLLDAYLED